MDTFKVERYLSAYRGYRLIASPVNTSNNTNDANSNTAYSLNYVKNSAYITGSSGLSGGLLDKVGNPTTLLFIA